MRTLITAALTVAALAPVAAPTAAGAQSAGEIRRDNREIREDRRDLRDAQYRGDVRDARRELREDRQDRREDWRDYREAHRDWYRRPAYVGPRGYAYRPITPGYRFAPGYYGRNYWVNDWQRYRLAAPLGYQRWVRYGNDVVLIDIRSGRVVTVHNGFFY